MSQNLKIAVVGAGPAGLVSAKYILQQGYKCDIFEQTESLGGNWVYKDFIGIDESGIEVQSSIYRDMVSNIPKELMAFPGFKYPESIRESYIHHNYVLEYHHAFAKHFDIKKHVQYYRRVTRITPMNEKWIITVKNVKSNTEHSYVYDAVFVCNGRFKRAFVPTIVGQALFHGIQTHSRNYRVPDPYYGQTVLIIGGNISGHDLVEHISKVANQVFFSCRATSTENHGPNVMLKPEVKKFTKDAVTFCDGTTERIDSVVYCTGYLHHCTFLTGECGVKLENNGVAPLYKQIINIEHPSMYFIGIPYIGANNLTFDLQARFAMAALTKKFTLPSKEKMLIEWDDFLKIKEKEGIPKKHLHRINISKESKEYSEDLAITANIAEIPRVFFKMYDRLLECNRFHYVYKIIDDETFEERDP